MFLTPTLQGNDQYRRGHTCLLSERSLQAVEGITTLHLSSEHGAVGSLRLQASSQSLEYSVVSAQQLYSRAIGPELECSTLHSIF